MKRKLPLFNLEHLELGLDGKPAGILRKMTGAIHRAKVAGGWLVFTDSAEGWSGVTFYPDPQHEWTGGTLD